MFICWQFFLTSSVATAFLWVNSPEWNYSFTVVYSVCLFLGQPFWDFLVNNMRILSFILWLSVSSEWTGFCFHLAFCLSSYIFALWLGIAPTKLKYWFLNLCGICNSCAGPWVNLNISFRALKNISFVYLWFYLYLSWNVDCWLMPIFRTFGAIN